MIPHASRFDVKVYPCSSLCGTVTAQPSKNYTTRFLLAAALSSGVSWIRGVAESEDSLALQSCLELWGAELKRQGNDIQIRGFGSKPQSHRVLNPRNAGAVTRFLIALAALTEETTFVTDHPNSLGRRPNGDLLAALRDLGVTVLDEDGRLPISVFGKNTQGGPVSVQASVSSQYLSGLIFLGPLLPLGLDITVLGDIKSQGPIRQTLHTLDCFGITAEASEDLRRIFIPGNQTYQARDIHVPGDYPGSIALLGAAALCGTDVTVDNLHPMDLQGERQALDVLREMGADLSHTGQSVRIKGPKPLKAVSRNGDPFTDAVQALSAVAAFAEGTTHFYNIETLRFKECDRISDTRSELNRLGVSVKETPDGLTISGQPEIRGGIVTDPHDDHRMVMMLTLIGLKCQSPLVILNAHAIRKSYPRFFEHLQTLGARFDFLPSTPDHLEKH